jgi:hypothetical protein
MMGEATLATADWGGLERELDLWAATGGNATFWWRDDDAARADPALDRLLDLRAGLPLALAVIPGRAEASLAERIAGERDIAVLQHGWMHTNHAPKGERAAELGAHRPIDIILDELATGWRAISALLGRFALPVLTPPWNRLTDQIVPRLREAGYRGLSTSGPRPQREASRGLVQVNAHIDLVDWRTRAFIGVPEALHRISAHLAARREGRADRGEPTGILTHHLVMDEESANFLERLLHLTRRHSATRWVAAAEAFAAP